MKSFKGKMILLFLSDFTQHHACKEHKTERLQWTLVSSLKIPSVFTVKPLCFTFLYSVFLCPVSERTEDLTLWPRRWWINATHHVSWWHWRPGSRDWSRSSKNRHGIRGCLEKQVTLGWILFVRPSGRYGVSAFSTIQEVWVFSACAEWPYHLPQLVLHGNGSWWTQRKCKDPRSFCKREVW